MYQFIGIQQIRIKKGRMGNCANTNDVAGNNNAKETETYPSVLKGGEKDQGKATIQQMIKFNNKSLKLPTLYKQSYSIIETCLNSQNKQSIFKVGKAYQNLMFYNHAITAYLRILKVDNKGEINKRASFQIIECYLEIGKYQQALEKCMEVEKQIKQHYGEGSEQYIGLLIKKGVCQTSMCKISQAKTTFLLAIQIIERNDLHNIPEQCTIYSKLGRLHINEGDIEMTVEMVKKSQDLANKLQSNLQASEALLQLSNIYETLGWESKALELLKRSQQIIIQKAGLESTDYINNLLFQIAFAKNCHALQDCQILLNKCSQGVAKIFGKQSIQYAELKCEEGLFHLAKANNVTAIKCFNQSFQTFQALQQKINQACPLILIQMIVGYLKIGSNQRAQQICQKAYSLVNQIYGQNTIQAAQIGSSFVQIMFQNDYLQAAQQSCQEIIQIYDELNLQQSGNYIRAVTNLAHIFRAKGDYENALKHFNIGQRLFQNQSKINPMYVEICSNLGLLYKEQGQKEVGQQYIKQSQEIDDKINKIIERLAQADQNKNA